MKKNISLIYLCSMLLFVFILISAINMNTIPSLDRERNIILLLFVLLLITIFNFGIRKDKNYLKGVTNRSVITFLLIFIIFIYGLGIILGFTRSYLSLNFKTEFSNVVPIIIIIIITELLKKVIFSKCFEDTKIIIIFTTLISALLVLNEINITALQTSKDKFIFLCTIILPIMSQEFLCSYITYKVSWIPSLIYKLVMNLYMYIVPIVPSLGNYIYSVLNILLPFLIYFDVNKIIVKYDKVKEDINKANCHTFLVLLIISFMIIVSLISGVFKYKLIAIASDSMQPAFSRGDAVLYEKVSAEDLNIGDIIAFEKDNIIVTHRIVKIWKRGNSYYFITKGDNNNSADTFNPTPKNVLGKVKCTFKYIGYPTILINELLGKE